MLKGKLVIIDGNQYDEYEIVTGKQVATIREYISTEEEITKNKIDIAKNEIIRSIEESQKLGNILEVERLQAEWATFCETNCYKTHAQALLERDELEKDANKWFGYAMNDKGWW